MDQEHPPTPPADDAPDSLGRVDDAGYAWLAYGRRPGPIAGVHQLVGTYPSEQDAWDALLVDALAPGGHLADVERTRVEIGDDGTGCPITEEQLPNGASVPGTERVDHRRACVEAGVAAVAGEVEARRRALAAIDQAARPGTAHFTGLRPGTVPWASTSGAAPEEYVAGPSGKLQRRFTGPGYLETTGYATLGDDVKHVEPAFPPSSPVLASDTAFLLARPEPKPTPAGPPPPPPGFRPAGMASLVDHVAKELEAVAAEDGAPPLAHLLPRCSVVSDPADAVAVYAKSGPESWERTGSVETFTDEDVDLLLGGGGKVLRVGVYGYPSSPPRPDAATAAAALAPRPPDTDVLREHHPLAGQPYRPERVIVGFDPSGLVFGWDGHAVPVEDWEAGFRVCKDCDPGVFKPGN